MKRCFYDIMIVINGKNMKLKLCIVLLSVSLLAAGCSDDVVTLNNQNTNAPMQSYTVADVASANTEQKCWTIIRGNVYDLTTFLSAHEGGKSELLKICGKDGTASFDAQHKGDGKPEDQLMALKLGTIQ